MEIIVSIIKSLLIIIASILLVYNLLYRKELQRLQFHLGFNPPKITLITATVNSLMALLTVLVGVVALMV